VPEKSPAWIDDLVNPDQPQWNYQDNDRAKEIISAIAPMLSAEPACNGSIMTTDWVLKALDVGATIPAI